MDESHIWKIAKTNVPLVLSSVLSSTMVSTVATLLELAFRSTPLVKTTLEILSSPSATYSVLFQSINEFGFKNGSIYFMQSFPDNNDGQIG